MSLEIKRALPAPLAQGKGSSSTTSLEDQQSSRKKKNSTDGLVGLVNIGNSCYMNATLQALSNCPPFRQYLMECHLHSQANSTLRVSESLAALYKKMWTADRHPGHLSPRTISSSMKNKMFRGSHQQDAQEFLRCLLTQVHEEIGIQVPVGECGCGQHRSCDHLSCPRDSMISCTSCESDTSCDSHTRTLLSVKDSPLIRKKPSGLSRHKLSGSHSSPTNSPKFSALKERAKILVTSSAKGSIESIPNMSQHGGSKISLVSQDSVEKEREKVKWIEGDLFVVDIILRKVIVHSSFFTPTPSTADGGSGSDSCAESAQLERPSSTTGQHTKLSSKESKCSVSSLHSTTSSSSTISGSGSETHCKDTPRENDSNSSLKSKSVDATDGSCTSSGGTLTASTEHARFTTKKEEEVKVVGKTGNERKDTSMPSQPCITLREKKSAKSRVSSIVSEVFEGILESRVKCLTCKKISVTREPFQDLSLPIPGRKEMAKYNSKSDAGPDEKGSSEDVGGRGKSTLSRGFCTVWNFMTALTRDYFIGPPTDIDDCLNAFFDTSELKGDNKYYCSNCKSFQVSQKEMSIIQLPEVLCIHFKRFRFDVYLSTKISRHIGFPLSGLDMSQYLKDPTNCHSCVYDLNAVVTHYGGAGGGHYVAFAKNSSRNSWFEFNDTRVYPVSADTVQGTEGYVMFYRRVAPATSQASQPLDVCSLLPRPGTRLPTPDVCYISRHWLHLLKHFTHPGPIFQHEYACKHGAVIPKRVEEARMYSMNIRREVWDTFQKRYGGGPLVPRLESCQTCQELLRRLTERRTEEKETIHHIQKQEREVIDREKKPEPFLLSIEWLQQWQKFIHATTLEMSPPPPIDNTPLLQVDGETITLVEGASFRKLSHATWSYFNRIYGGGPTIVTSLDAIQKGK